MRFDLRCPVDCADGTFGELADVVIDPGTHCLTHLVVQPHEHHEFARLVPMGRAHVERGRSGGRVSLDFTVAEVNELEPLQDSAYLRLGERPGEAPGTEIGIEEISEVPAGYSLGVEALGAGMVPVDLDPHVTVRYDRLPKGTVEIRRESEVTSSDGRHVGHVIGLVVGDQERIAELVLEHGHFWGKRELVIPFGSVDRVTSDEVILALSSDEVGRLK